MTSTPSSSQSAKNQLVHKPVQIQTLTFIFHYRFFLNNFIIIKICAFEKTYGTGFRLGQHIETVKLVNYYQKQEYKYNCLYHLLILLLVYIIKGHDCQTSYLLVGW